MGDMNNCGLCQYLCVNRLLFGLDVHTNHFDETCGVTIATNAFLKDLDRDYPCLPHHCHCIVHAVIALHSGASTMETVF